MVDVAVIDHDSPGRIDASCIQVYGLILDAIVHTALPRAPQPGRTGGQSGSGVSVYGRRIGK